MTSRNMPLLTCLVLLCLLLHAATGFAEHDEGEPQYPSLVDRTHKGISESLSAPARWFDSFFRDPDYEEEEAGTRLRLIGSVTAEDGEDPVYKARVRAKLRLPHLKKRFHLFISGDEDDLRDTPLRDARVNPELADKEDNSIALQYTQERRSELNLSHRLKVEIDDDELNPELRSRLRYSLPIANESILTLTQAVFWEHQDGLGEETLIDYDIPLAQKTLLRTSAQGLFSESSSGYQWFGMQQLLQSFSHKKALAIGAYLAGQTRPDNHVTVYDAFVRYRQRFIKKWMFVEVKPEVQWLRDRDFEPTGIVTLTLELQFED